MRRTKIVCTIGPASSSTAELDRLVAAGLDVARLNFSHGTHEEHAQVIRRIREGEARWSRPVAILQDLQGPKIRLGTFGPGGGARVDLEPDGVFALSMRSVVGTAERASITHPEFLKDLRPGDQLWMDDGMIQLRVEAVLADEVRCRVVVGGRISDHKGLSLPHVSLPMSCLTDKDREDLKFGLRQRVDFVAVSFVRSAGDIEEVRSFLRAEGADDVPLVAKLERHEVLANLPGILNVVDAVMVARGDLGVGARRARDRGVHRIGLLGPPHLPGAPERADHRAHAVRRGPATAGPLVGGRLASHPEGRDDRRDDRGGRGDPARRRRGARQRRDRHHLGLADVGPRHDESAQAPSGGRASHVRLALGHRSVRGLILLLVGLLTLWSVAGFLLSRQLASRQATTVGAALASVQAIVATAFEDVRREAWLLSQDPAVVEGTNRSDWATLARGAGPRMQALTRERFADLLLIVDATGTPLVQVPVTRPVLVPAMARPRETVARLAVVDERLYVLGIAPLPSGMVVVGRRFEGLEASLARLPTRAALA